MAAKVVSLDSYCGNMGIANVNFIKIDVEGMEYEVIRGAEMILKKHHPILYFESLENFEQTRGFAVFAEIENLLKSLGYGFYSVTNSGEIGILDRVGGAIMTLAIPEKGAVLRVKTGTGQRSSGSSDLGK